MALKLTHLKSFKLPVVPGKDPAKRLLKSIQRWLSQIRREVLLDLVGTDQSNVPYFWKKWGWLFMPREADDELLGLRDQLRLVWTLDPLADLALRQWLEWRSPVQPTWIVDSHMGLLAPNPSILRFALAIGVIELGSRFAKCANPQCPQPYFLRSRRGQRVCESWQCVAFALGERKREWWRKHGKEWRAKRRAELKKRQSQRKRGK